MAQYIKGQKIAVLDGRTRKVMLRGEIDAVTRYQMVIKPEERPHESYRVTVPVPDINHGHVLIVREDAFKGHVSNAGEKPGHTGGGVAL